MKIKIRCTSIEHRLTGHNDTLEYVYSFVPELVFGLQPKHLEGFNFRSEKCNLFDVGSYYEMEIK